MIIKEDEREDKLSIMKEITRYKYLINLVCEKQVRMIQLNTYDSKEYEDLEKIKIRLSKKMKHLEK